MIRLGLLLTIAMWASQYPLVNDLARRWDPFTISLLRYLSALLVLAAYLQWQNKLRAVIHQIPDIGWNRLTGLGLAMGLFAICLSLGIAIGDPVTTAIIAASSPIAAAFFSWWLLGERPRRTLVLAAALAIPGGAIASLSDGDIQFFSPKVGGALLVLLAHVFWCWYSINSQRWIPSTSQVAIVTITMTAACVVLATIWVLALVAGAVYVDPFANPLGDATMYLVIGAGAASLGVVLWGRAVARIGVTEATLYLNVIPIFAAGIAYGFGILPSPSQLIGAAMVMSGILLTVVMRHDHRTTSE